MNTSKGCPFCNSHIVKISMDMRVKKHQVVCVCCAAEGPLSSEGPQGAMDLWRWRSKDESTDLQERLDKALSLVARLRDKNNKLHIELHGSLVPEGDDS